MQLNNVGPEFGPGLKEFFAVAGVSEQQLKDDATRNFIYSFIDSHGGVDKAIQSIKAAPAAPTTKPNVTPAVTPAIPPNIPVRSHKQHNIPRPPPPLPPPPSSMVSSSAPVPPPPPPPPMIGVPIPPPMPSSIPTSNAGNQDNAVKSNNGARHAGGHLRNALMEQIRHGTQLNPVDAENDSLKSSGSSNGGGRDALLTQIRKGVELRKTEHSERKVCDVAAEGGMAAALKKALEMRQKMMNSDSEDESDSSCPDEEEWAECD